MKKIIDQLYEYIEKTYEFNEPFLLNEIYDVFPNIKQGTIRESIRRLYEQEKIIKSKNGVYGLPNPNRILKTAVMNSEDVVNKKYIKSEDGNIIGYNEKLFAYKWGQIIYDFFNQYFGFDDSYWDEEFKPSRWQMALNKLIIIEKKNQLETFFSLITSKKYLYTDNRGLTEIELSELLERGSELKSVKYTSSKFI